MPTAVCYGNVDREFKNLTQHADVCAELAKFVWARDAEVASIVKINGVGNETYRVQSCVANSIEDESQVRREDLKAWKKERRESRLKGRTEMASSSFSTSRRSRRRVVLVWQPSREDEYEGPRRYCHHGFVAPRWTAWTRRNPGRRFYGCPNYNQDDACGFFDWHDVEFGVRANVVIKQLLDDIDKLYDESKRIRGGEVVGFVEELDSIHGELRRLRHKYKIRETDVIKGERKFKIVMVILMLTWVWILFFS